MEHTWRWFGPDDPISLEEVRQASATGIVTALHHIPNGEVWSPEEIRARKSMIEAAGLRWSVVESVPVHEHIKWGGPEKDRAIENYATTLRNLADAGIDVVCYNFMPVLDWTRTELFRPLPRGGSALAFDFDAYAAFDLFILKRPGASDDHTDAEIARATAVFEELTAEQQDALTETILKGLPGSEESFTLDSFREALARYANVTRDKLRGALFEFLGVVVPVADRHGVRLAIHPDDPPRPMFGLPRIVSNADDVEALLDAQPLDANGITLCVGSYASDPDNDASEIARRFAHRTWFAHLRNVRVGPDRKSFIESDHLDGDVDMVEVISILVAEEERRARAGLPAASIPMRPDHGHILLDDHSRPTRPGYTLIGRMKGLSQLAGVELAVSRLRAKGAS